MRFIVLVRLVCISNYLPLLSRYELYKFLIMRGFLRPAWDTSTVFKFFIFDSRPFVEKKRVSLWYRNALAFNDRELNFYDFPKVFRIWKYSLTCFAEYFLS